MKRILVLILAVLATPALATTYIDVDADSARIPAGQATTIVPLNGGDGSGPRNLVNYPNQSSNNCAIFAIPAVPQTMSNTPSLICRVTFRDPAAVPASNVQWQFAAQAFPTGDSLVDTFFSLSGGAAVATMAGTAQNNTNGSIPSSNFPIVEASNVPCGTECLGRPLLIRLCRQTATGDTLQVVSIACEE